MLAEAAVASALAAQEKAAAKAKEAQAAEGEEGPGEGGPGWAAEVHSQQAAHLHIQQAAKEAEACLAAKVAKLHELQAEEARVAAEAAKREEERIAAEIAALDAIPVPPQFLKAIAEAEQRIANAKMQHIKFCQDSDVLRAENDELKLVVSKARINVERVILKKRADNVQMLSDNADLEKFTSEARMLAEQKAQLHPSKSVDGNSDWDVIQRNNVAIRRKLERVLSRPQRMPVGASMDSPRSNLSSLEATPRIDAVQEWRTSNTAGTEGFGASGFASGMVSMSNTRTSWRPGSQMG